MCSNEPSYHTSSWWLAIRNRQPGGKPRYLRTAGHQSERCSTCNGLKKSGPEDSSPAQMYHPAVSPCGACRNPFSGIRPSRTLSATPTLNAAAVGQYATPYRWQTFFCSSSVVTVAVSTRLSRLHEIPQHER